MQRLILAHVAGDEAAAHRLCAVVGGVPVLVRHAATSVQVGAGAVLGVVWSAGALASPAGVRLSELAAEAPSAVVFRSDETPVCEALAAQRLITVTPDASEDDLRAAVRLAQRVQPRRPVARSRRDFVTPDLAAPAAPSEPKAAYGRMFVSGMTRGFASSVAILSLGAGAAVGVQENAGVLGAGDGVARSFEPSGAHVEHIGATRDLEESAAMPGLVSDTELAQQASALRQAAAAQRQVIDDQLSGAERQLADARLRTDAVIARLNAISAQTSTFAAATPRAGAAPPVRAEAEAPQLAESLQPAPPQPAVDLDFSPVVVDLTVAPPQKPASPAEDVYALTRYADGLADAGAKPVEPSKLALWSPI
ncbi:MAG TPA: hypothetical protein VG841_06910 [Caulobacterales bacterium]|nr:hypothetical protein [Caulobacterales bacterium]